METAFTGFKSERWPMHTCEEDALPCEGGPTVIPYVNKIES